MCIRDRLTASIIYFISGMPLIIGVIIFLLSLTGIALSYIYIDHFTQRLNIFLNPSLGDTYQIDTAYNAITNGGWFGVGPGEGTIKNILPKGVKVTSVRQSNALGLGHAVLCAKHLLNNEPFAVLLPDVLVLDKVSRGENYSFIELIKAWDMTGIGQMDA